jgi:acetyltransferase-like isoleucine patch superfamily enzyme
MGVTEEIGIKKILKFAFFEPIMVFYKLLIYPPIRKAFLKLFGAKIGRGTIIHETSFFNLYRKGLPGLEIGKKCFIGNETMLDLADKIILQDNVTLAERVMILTHMNVGYKDHPLQKHFKSFAKPVIIGEGCFIGAGVIILPGINIGEHSLIAAGSIVTKNIPPNSIAAGNPAQVKRTIH